MPTSVHRGHKSLGQRIAGQEPEDLLWLVLLVALPLAVIGFALVLPPDLILPAVAVVAIGTGLVLEGARLISRGRQAAMRLREYAAGLVFVGLAATILADPDGAVLALNEMSNGGSGKNGSDR
ncbi:MAG: hypothetical protein AB7E81_20910 [Hyphomicrobiaceae bacterium]